MGSEERKEKIKDIIGRRQSGLVVVLEDISDPHNAAAVIRSAEAFGISNVWLIFNEGKSFNPRKVGGKSSSHANKWIAFKKFKSSEECITALKKEGYKIVVTTLDSDAVSIYTTDFEYDKIALFLGNEHSGLLKETIAMADKKVHIPMRGMVQSLNISVTAGIFIYEVTRQRMKNFERYTISETDARELFKGFENV